jgi:hypothetical protein
MSAISTSKISEFSDNDIVAKFSECAPLYKLWLTKFIKYHDSNKVRFRASKGVSIFGFIYSELKRCSDIDISNIDSVYARCGLFNPSTKQSNNVDFFTAIKKLMIDHNIFVEHAIDKEAAVQTSPVAEIGPRKKLKFIQAIFEAESRDITKNIVTKLLRKVPFMDIVWYCALRRKELAFLQMDTAFTDIGNPRVGPVPRIPGMHFDMYSVATSPVIACNGAHLIPYMKEKINPPDNNAYYIEERLEHEPSTQFTLTVLEAQEMDTDVYDFYWIHFQETGKQRIQKIFDTLEFLYDQLLVSMPTARNSNSAIASIRRISRNSNSSNLGIKSKSKSKRSRRSAFSRQSRNDNQYKYIDSRIHIISKMWWWFCQAMPLYRGSAAVGEFIFKPMIEIYTQYRYTLRPGRSPENLVDIHALTYGKDEFVAIFKNQFLIRRRQ